MVLDIFLQRGAVLLYRFESFIREVTLGSNIQVRLLYLYSKGNQVGVFNTVPVSLWVIHLEIQFHGSRWAGLNAQSADNTFTMVEEDPPGF